MFAQTQAEAGTENQFFIVKTIADVGKAIVSGCWDVTKHCVRGVGDGIKAVGTGCVDGTKDILNTSGGAIRHIGDSAITSFGTASKDLGNYSVDAAKSMY